jgi:hypothetical protein
VLCTRDDRIYWMQIKGFKLFNAFDTFKKQYDNSLKNELVNLQSKTSGLLKVCLEEICFFLDPLIKAPNIYTLIKGNHYSPQIAADTLENTLKSIFLAKELIKDDHLKRTLDGKLTELLECFGVNKIELDGVDASKLEKFTSLLVRAKDLDYQLFNDDIVKTLTNHFDLFYYFVESLKDYKKVHNSLPFNNDSSQFQTLKDLAEQGYKPNNFEEFSSTLSQVLEAQFFESEDLMSLFREQLFVTFHSCFQLILDQIQNMDLGLIEKSIEKYGSSSVTYVFDKIPHLFNLVDNKIDNEAQKQEFFGKLNKLIQQTIDSPKDFFGFHKQIEKIQKKLSKDETNIIKYFQSLP